MNLKQLQRNWNAFAKIDPLWAILTEPDKKGNKWGVDEFFDTGKQEIDSLLEYTKSLSVAIPRKRALDFGCGVGRLTQALASYFDEVTGVDIAPRMLKQAEKYNRFGVKCKYHLNETDDLNLFVDNTFDFIYTNIVLQHMRPEYSKGYIRELLRILTPRGLLIFQLPSELLWDSINRPPRPQRGEHRQSTTKSSRLKQLIKRVTPEPVLTSYRNLRYGEPKREPVMEMYAINREEVVQLLTENGAEILDIVQDVAGPYWISFRYCATKK